MKVSVGRKAHFNAAHRLFNPLWDEEKNTRIFGKCASPNFHGHNYLLEVWVTGEVNPDTGFVMDTSYLKELIKTQIEDRFDHKNLNLDTDEFAKLNPTVENICVVIWRILRSQIPENLMLRVRLYETERNVAEYAGD